MTEGRRPGITGPSYFETVAASAGSAFPGSNLSCDGFKRRLSYDVESPAQHTENGAAVWRGGTRDDGQASKTSPHIAGPIQ